MPTPLEVEQHLDATGRYGKLLAAYRADSSDMSRRFELYFAYWLEAGGVAVEYEVDARQESARTVDFRVTLGRSALLLELVYIEHSDEVLAHIQAQQTADTLFHSYSLIMSSDHGSEKFRTAAQLIRLQEKILEKGDKFPPSTPHVFSVIVVDCSNIHAGMLDEDDVRITCFGRAHNPAFQEYWNGSPLIGLFEDKYNARGGTVIRERIHAIGFLKELDTDSLPEVLIAINPAFDSEGAMRIVSVLNRASVVRSTR